ncbi:acyloxyacyl hydrolase [Shewanella sp. JM162201]|uniref:Acyloxyacyl hydrolase n=1 Tax=Shewanella jiangmenensis TaxID=2837387 RepID=A0ABS5V6A0_9GAMM|nr:acyloxyacyl hydrolase [Shewanella jiangmenensis]MBT1445361.1 acyloxyacyl hydrolase [Shewanella jiangmenensis]
MRKLKLQGIVLTLGLCTAYCYALNENGIAFSSGIPASEQNKEISSMDMGYDHTMWEIGDDLAYVGFNVRAGQLSLDDESTLRLGTGLFLTKEIGKLTFSIPAGLLWLEQSEFGSNELHTKDYGGHVQFFLGAEVGYEMTRNWQFFYRFEHMSNGNRYELNPALNSHNLGFRVMF